MKRAKTKIKDQFLDIIVRYSILIITAIPNLWLFYLIFTPATVYIVYFLLGLFFNVSLIGDVILVSDSLPIEIIPAESHSFFDYDAKYSGESEEICPGNFSDIEKEKIQNFARDVHEILGLRHYSRSDFIVADDGIYFLEVNTLPGLTEQSLLPKSINAVGATFPQFLDHLVTTALSR